MTELLELWAIEQPADPSSLAGLIDDFAWRSHRRQFDFARRERAGSAEDIAEAIDVACEGVDDSSALLRVRKQTLLAITRDGGSFGDLMELLSDALPRVEQGVRYEVAVCWCEFTGAPAVDAVYPSERRTKALRALGLPADRPVRRSELPLVLASRALRDVNDFLSIYADEIEVVSARS